MSKQKKKGSQFEKDCAEHLTERLGVTVRRNALMGALDQGDLFGIVIGGKPFTVECKDYSGEYRLSKWSEELEREMGCCDTDIGTVIFKMAGAGPKHMEEQGVFMRLKTLCALIEGMVEK